jgi:hydroxyacylglutathione hydrolase
MIGMSLGPSVECGILRPSWLDESDGPGTPRPFLVHAYNPDFVILRQAGRSHFEKPFLYVLVGRARALLVDSGAPGADTAGAVREVLGRRAAALGTPVPPLVVTHTHGHDDHVAGDAGFRDLPGVVVAGTGVTEVSALFGIRSWPDDVGSLDLGSRVVDAVPVPGHDGASLAFYDRRTGILLSGDVLYPGRLYVRDADAFRASVKRLVAFTRGRPVCHILGAHIENRRTPYRDYPEGTLNQPDEHPLELGRAHLLELDAALDEMAGRLDRRAFRDFTIWPVASGQPAAGAGPSVGQ